MSLVWGEKAILDELEALMHWRPSRRWFERWSTRDDEDRLPIKRLGRRIYADTSQLNTWFTRVNGRQQESPGGNG